MPTSDWTNRCSHCTVDNPAMACRCQVCGKSLLPQVAQKKRPPPLKKSQSKKKTKLDPKQRRIDSFFAIQQSIRDVQPINLEESKGEKEASPDSKKKAVESTQVISIPSDSDPEEDYENIEAAAPTLSPPVDSDVDDDKEVDAVFQPGLSGAAGGTQLYTADDEDEKESVSQKGVAPTQIYIDDDDDEDVDTNSMVRGIGPRQIYKDDEAVSEAVASPSDEEPSELMSTDFEPRRGIKHLVSSEGSVYYAVVARALDAVSSTRSRLSKDRALVNAFRWLRHCEAEEFEATAYLLAPVKDSQTGGHRLQPEYASPDGGLGLGWRSVIEQAILDATGSSRAELTTTRKKTGDSADAAAALMKRLGARRWCFGTKPRPLSVTEVRDTLLQLGLLTGSGANARKAKLLTSLFGRATAIELAWLVRTCCAHMSCGISLEASVIPALTQAISPQCPTQAARAAYARRPDVRCVVDALLSSDNDKVKALKVLETQCAVQFGVPPQPMLATPATSVADALKDLGRQGSSLLAEHKYDGQRAQIHRSPDGTITIFSRKLDEITNKYPQIIRSLNDVLGDQCCVLDAEIMAENNDGESHVFQALASKKNDVYLAVFDLLWLGERCICNLPLSERRRLLIHEVLPKNSSSIIRLARSIQVDPDALQLVERELVTAVEANCEGLVVKRLDSIYEISGAGIRSKAWVKLKKDYIEGMVDSLDLVPIGGWRGSGRKSNWISPILMATYDRESQELGCVSRVMSGFSDEFYDKFTRRVLGTASICQPRENDSDDILLLNAPASGVSTSEHCEFWFRPCLVWEIRAADITLSPTHRSAAGIFHATRGLSLRFPRFIRERPDKSIEHATSSTELALFYRQQQSRGAGPPCPPTHMNIEKTHDIHRSDFNEKPTPAPRRDCLYKEEKEVHFQIDGKPAALEKNGINPMTLDGSSSAEAEELERRRLLRLGADES